MNRITPGQLTEIGPVSARLGGCVANTVRGLTALDVPAVGTTDIGNDDLSELAARLAETAGFAMNLDKRESASTSFSVAIEPQGADRSFWHHAGANNEFTGSGIDLAGVSILHVGYPSLLAAVMSNDGRGLAELFRRAKRDEATTSLDLAVVDPHSRAAAADWKTIFDEVLPLVDILSPSAEDMRSIAHAVDLRWSKWGAEDFADDLVRRGVAVAAVSDGASGQAFAAGPTSRMRDAGKALADRPGWAGEQFHEPTTLRGPVVTTNGAGDAATAGLIAGVWRGLPLREAAALSSHTASLALEGALMWSVRDGR